jgi:hypothetical protein
MSSPNRGKAGLSTPDTIGTGQDRFVPCVNIGAAHPLNGGPGTRPAASLPDRGPATDRSTLQSSIASAARRDRSATVAAPTDLQSP